MKTILWFALSLLTACASCPCERIETHDAGPRRAETLPPLEPDPEPVGYAKPCEKSERVKIESGVIIDVPLPCRPFDARRDLGMPQP